MGAVLLIAIFILVLFACFIYFYKKTVVVEEDREGLDNFSQPTASQINEAIALTVMDRAPGSNNFLNQVGQPGASTNPLAQYITQSSTVSSSFLPTQPSQLGSQSTQMINNLINQVSNNSNNINGLFDSSGKIKDELVLPIQNGLNTFIVNMKSNLTKDNLNAWLTNVISLATAVQKQLNSAPSAVDTPVTSVSPVTCPAVVGTKPAISSNAIAAAAPVVGVTTTGSTIPAVSPGRTAAASVAPVVSLTSNVNPSSSIPAIGSTTVTSATPVSGTTTSGATAVTGANPAGSSINIQGGLGRNGDSHVKNSGVWGQYGIGNTGTWSGFGAKPTAPLTNINTGTKNTTNAPHAASSTIIPGNYSPPVGNANSGLFTTQY